jgi:hypothetical protein
MAGLMHIPWLMASSQQLKKQRICLLASGLSSWRLKYRCNELVSPKGLAFAEDSIDIPMNTKAGMKTNDYGEPWELSAEETDHLRELADLKLRTYDLFI